MEQQSISRQEGGSIWGWGNGLVLSQAPGLCRSDNIVAAGGSQQDSDTHLVALGGRGGGREILQSLFICGVGVTSRPNRRPVLLRAILDPIASVGAKIRKLWADALDPVVSLRGESSKALWAGTSPSPGAISLTSGQEITSILPFSTAANSTCTEGVLTQVRNAALESMC